MVLIAESKEKLEKMILELEKAGKEAGMEINFGKTKILANTTESYHIECKGKKKEKVQEIIYLGQLITFEERTEREVKRRIILAWKKYWILKRILKGSFNNKQKSKIFNSCVLPTLT